MGNKTKNKPGPPSHLPTFGEDVTGTIFSPEVSDNITSEQFNNEQKRLDEVKDEWQHYHSTYLNPSQVIDNPTVRRANDNYVETIIRDIDRTKQALEALEREGSDLAMLDYLEAKQDTLNTINSFNFFIQNNPIEYGYESENPQQYTNIAFLVDEGISRNPNNL